MFNMIRIFLISLSLLSFVSIGLVHADSTSTAKKPAAADKKSSKIDINTAGVDVLVTLKGIGKKKAQLIVDDRTKNGLFKTVDDLTRIKGIGPKTVEKNRHLIVAVVPQSKQNKK